MESALPDFEDGEGGTAILHSLIRPHRNIKTAQTMGQYPH